MKTRRLTADIVIALILLTSVTTAQVPNSTVPSEEPPAPEAQPLLPPGIPEFVPPGTPPALPDSNTPVPGMTPELPNLQVPPPPGIEGLSTPPIQPTLRQSNNPLLKLFDTNGDGVLSGDEVELAPARLWELDRNFDAELSADELALVLAPRWQERRRGVRGHVPVEPPAVAPMSTAPVTPDPALPALPGTARTDERAKFEIYPLRGLDPGQTLATLQQLLQNHPEARMTFDGRSQSILALAPPSVHAQIRETLADLLEGNRRGIPGLTPTMEGPAAPNAALPVIPRPVPLYNARAKDVLRIVKRMYRSKIVEPSEEPPAGLPGLPPDMPVVPAGKMVIGEGIEPNTIVISAGDELFFEVLELIESLDGAQEVPASGTLPPAEQ